jgi:hypothetical protein
MHNYTTLKDGNGFNVLIKDGKEAFCPYIPPLAMPDKFGGHQIIRLSCNTGCPHCVLHTNGDGSNNSIHVSCGHKEQIFSIAENVTSLEPKLIKI